MPASYATIDRLALRAKDGDTAAKECLVMAFKPLVYKLAGQLPARPFDDTCQDLWVAFMRALARYDPAQGNGFAAYIKAYLSLESRKMARGREGPYKDHSVRADVSFDAPPACATDAPLSETIPDPKADILRAALGSLEGKQQCDKVRAWYESLSPDQRAILKGVHSGQSFTDIGEPLDRCQQSVSRAYYRMRRQFQHHLSS